MNRCVPTFIRVSSGQAGEVWLLQDVYETYRRIKNGTNELEVKQRTQLERFMREFCANIRPALNDEQFKKEDSFKNKGGHNATVFAFKPFKARFYGVVTQIGNKKVFLGLKVDPAKRQDKANRALLVSTADAYFNLNPKEIEVRNEDEFDAAR